MMLHRPDYHEPGQHEGIIEVIIAKQRNGPTGEITLMYVKQYMQLRELRDVDADCDGDLGGRQVVRLVEPDAGRRTSRPFALA